MEERKENPSTGDSTTGSGGAKGSRNKKAPDFPKQENATGPDCRARRPWALGEGKDLPERFDGVRFVVLDVKDGVQLGDLQQVVDLFGEVEQLEIAALIAHRGEGADQFADA